MNEFPFVPLSGYREYPCPISHRFAPSAPANAGGGRGDGCICKANASQGAHASMAARNRSLAPGPRAKGLMMGRSRPEAR